MKPLVSHSVLLFVIRLITIFLLLGLLVGTIYQPMSNILGIESTELVSDFETQEEPLEEKEEKRKQEQVNSFFDHLSAVHSIATRAYFFHSMEYKPPHLEIFLTPPELV